MTFLSRYLNNYMHVCRSLFVHKRPLTLRLNAEDSGYPEEHSSWCHKERNVNRKMNTSFQKEMTSMHCQFPYLLCVWNCAIIQCISRKMTMTDLLIILCPRYLMSSKCVHWNFRSKLIEKDVLFLPLLQISPALTKILLSQIRIILKYL